MKIINYTAGYHGRTLVYRDDAQADEAYLALKKAISEYKEYGNDTVKSVTVPHGNGEVSIRLGLNGLADVCIDALDDEGVATLTEYEAFRKRVRAVTETQPTNEVGAVASIASA